MIVSEVQIIAKAISQIQRVVQTALKLDTLRILLRLFRREHCRLLSYVSKENQTKIDSFLQADKFEFDPEKTLFRDDTQVSPHKSRFTCIPVKISQLRPHQDHFDTSKVARNSVKISSSSTHCRLQQDYRPNSSQINIIETPCNLIPLWAQGWIEENRGEEQEDFANRARQRRTKREIFKSKFQENEQLRKRKIGKPKEIQQKPKPKPKKDKFNYIQHFVEMQVSTNEPLSDQLKENQKFPLNKLRGNKKKTQAKSLNSSPTKQLLQTNLLFPTRKWEPLVPQGRQLQLKDPQQIEVASGVTIRQSLPKGISNSSHQYNSNTTRKKIQMLKNSEGKSIPLKFNELMSYKRLGSMTHLTYCTSMRTLKDLKEATETNISIDSRQFVGEEPDSKTLIKIANRRVYEQLMLGEEGEGTRKSRIRLKKEGRVRFDNMAQI